MSSQKTLLEERKIPYSLVEATLRAREASEAQRSFREEMDLYLNRCKSEGFEPESRWLNLLEYLAGGKDTIGVSLALKVNPRSKEFLMILETLKFQDFPKSFVGKLISEAPSVILNSETKDSLRKQLDLSAES